MLSRRNLLLLGFAFACDIQANSLQVRLYSSDCSNIEYENKVIEAIEDWNETGSVFLEYHGCFTSVHQVDLKIPLDYDNYSSVNSWDLRDHLGDIPVRSGEVSVYVVNTITGVLPDGTFDLVQGAGGAVGCNEAAIITEPSARLISHEIGHIFGLPHSDTSGNLMKASRKDVKWDLTEDQLNRAEIWFNYFLEDCI